MDMSEVRVVIPKELDRTLEALMKAGFAGNKAELVRAALLSFLSTLPTQLPKGYDLETAFSPDGRIFQLEYAREATRKGGTILGICCQEGVVLAKEIKKELEEKNPFLVIPNPFMRIFKINQQIGLVYSGIMIDAQVLVREAEKIVDEMEKKGGVEITELARELAFYMQPFCQRKDHRPLGVAIILGGLDSSGKPHLFLMDSGGLALECKACVVGSDEEKIQEKMKEGYNPKMNLKDALLLATKALLTEKKKAKNLLMATIDTDTKTFRELTENEKREIINKINL